MMRLASCRAGPRPGRFALIGIVSFLSLAVSADAQVTQRHYLKASNTDAGDRFGWSIDASEDFIVVGANHEDSAATGVNGDQFDNSGFYSGAVYVYTRSGSSWVQEAYLKSSNSEGGTPQLVGDQFGISVAVDGDTIAVGAYREDSAATGVDGDQSDNSASSAGAVYVFVRDPDGTSWSQQAYIKASNTDADDDFGRSVDLSGDTLVVGAKYEDGGATGVNGADDDNAPWAGAAYVFVRNGTTWTQQAYLKGSNTNASDRFGGDVAISGDTIVVGAIGESSPSSGVDGDQTNQQGAPATGAAYVFVRNGTTWTQQAFLKASNPETVDYFGDSVAIDGDTVVVGADWEDSGTTGVNGDGDDNSVERAGAAYVYVRDGATWSFQAYLKPSHVGERDHFGVDVAVSGDTIAVGALNENGDGASGPADESVEGAGAVWMFERVGGQWCQSGYLKADNADPWDILGAAVAVSGDTVVTTAFQEDGGDTGVDGVTTDNGADGAGAAYVFDIGRWKPAAPALAGTGGVTPCLWGDGNLGDGDLVTMSLMGALPGALAYFVLGASEVAAPFKGGILTPSVDILIPSLPVDGNGEIVFGFGWPSGVPPGVSLYYQYWIADAGAPFGFSSSNGLRSTTP